MRIIRNGWLYQLTFLPRAFPVNCYLVEEEDGLTLIDTALPYSAKPILEAARGIGRPIVRIVLTHAHSDHVSSLDSLHPALPGASVFISHRDARLLKGDSSLDEGEPQTPIRGGVPKPGKIKTTPDVQVRDGDRIGHLEAISTPGHTPGSMSFIDTRNRFVIAGDAFQTRGGFAVSGQMRPLFPFPAMATWNADVAMDSARRILEYKPRLLAVGHGDMLEEPSRRIDEAIRKRGK